MKRVSVVRSETTEAARAGSTGLSLARMCATTVALMVATLAAALGASTAAAAVQYFPAGQLFARGTDGVPVHQQRLAVDDASGLILVTNLVEDRIDVYAPGAGGGRLVSNFGSGELTDPFGLAIDQRTGAVYVSDSARNRIVRYTRGPGDPPAYTFDAGFTSPALGAGAGQIGDFAAALAIDGSTDKLLVADPGNNVVSRYTLGGAYDGVSFDGSDSGGGAFRGLLDLAIDSTGDVIVVDSTGDIAGGAGTSRVLRFDSAGSYEGQIGAELSRPATVAVRQVGDEVLISSNQDAVMTDTAPLLDVYESDGTHIVNIPIPGSDFGVVTGIALGAGESGMLYVGTDVDRSFYGGLWGQWSVKAFAPPQPAAVTGETVSPVKQESARLAASISTNGAVTVYWFEYGPLGAGLPNRTSLAILPDGPNPQEVSAEISGLAPFSDYEFRVIANNGLGPQTIGRTVAFRTLPIGATASLGAVTDVTLDGATLNGTLVTHGASATYGFSVTEIGGPFHLIVPPVMTAESAEPIPVTTRISGLRAGRTYAVGLYAHNGAGTAFAEPVAFTTTSRPPVADPPRLGDDGSTPYGCLAPRLDTAARNGDQLVITGSDLGIYGTVTFGETPAEIRSYSAERVVVAVPDDVTGRTQVTVDCGRASNTVAVSLGGGSAKPRVTGVSVRGGTATIGLRLPWAGTANVRGRYVTGASVKRTGPGRATVRVTLTRRGRRALVKAANRRLSIHLTIRCASAEGDSASIRRVVVFKR